MLYERSEPPFVSMQDIVDALFVLGIVGAIRFSHRPLGTA
jgi:hypothetical protein